MQVTTHPYDYGWRARFPRARGLFAVEGGAAYAAEEDERCFVILDEASMADFLMPGEDDDILNNMITIIEYESREERRADLADRAQRAGRPAPRE